MLGNAGQCWAVLGSAESLRGSNHKQKGTSCPSNQERQWSRQAGERLPTALSREASIFLLHHLHQCEPHLSQGWHLFMGRRHSILNMVTYVSKGDCDLGKVAQEGVARLSPAQSIVLSKESLLPRVTDLNISLSHLTFLITGTAKKQVTTAGVSRACWGMLNGHMPLRL